LATGGTRETWYFPATGGDLLSRVSTREPSDQFLFRDGSVATATFETGDFGGKDLRGAGTVDAVSLSGR
jgi:hypothetical protein